MSISNEVETAHSERNSVFMSIPKKVIHIKKNPHV